MNDRDLLEAAAKAAGITHGGWSDTYQALLINANEHGVYEVWSPLTDDGDALRLAVKCGIRIDLHPRWVYARAVYPGQPSWIEITQGWGNGGYPHDPYAATRRAIVRAAAALSQEEQR